jgi:hypothetical protein
VTRLFLLFTVLSAGLWAQVWSGSGSNGSDGALNLGSNTPGVAGGVLIFDPVALGLDADADNVYHFTTITIRDSLEVRFHANRMRRPGPVVFLASGGVAIAGRLVFNGESGHAPTNNDALRRISIPGPGGYPGGVGGRGSAEATPGFGPGGGKVAPRASTRGCPGTHTNPVTLSWCESPPPAYGSNLVQPLVGGSGGSGANSASGGGGGAGGGAIRISSDAHIVFGTSLGGVGNAVGCSTSYYVTASGGDGGGLAGAGAGGAIHLQAPIVVGCGTNLYTFGGVQGGGTSGRASEGRIRVDLNSGGVVANPSAVTSALVDAPLPPSQPFLKVVSINGIPVPDFPKFDYASPDVAMDVVTPVPVVVQGNNIPVGTPVTLFLTTETGLDITTTITLAGTLANSTATTNVTLPLGTAYLIARAVW